MPAYSAQPRGTTELGLRLGIFSNSRNEFQQPANNVKLFANKTNGYMEGFLDYYFLDVLALAVNLGTYSKGDIRFDHYINGAFDGSFIGTASIYPMQLGLKFSPFRNQLPQRFQPYIEGGGALIVGRETITIGDAYSWFAQNTDGSIGSETDLNLWVGGGGEIPISEKINLDIMVKYIRTRFSGDIAGIKDYSGLQVSIGVGFLHISK